MTRDGKRLPLSTSCGALPYFLLCAFVVLPLTVGLLLPLLLVHTLVSKLLGLCGIGRAPRDKAASPSDREGPLLPTGESAPAAAISAASVSLAVVNAPAAAAAANRAHDIVLFGATGFTGKLAAQYLAARYSGKDSNVRWAIAGRRAAALESLRAELQLPELPIIIADATDGASLAAPHEKSVQSRPRCSTSNLASSAAGTRGAAPATDEEEDEDKEDKEDAVADEAAPESFCA